MEYTNSFAASAIPRNARTLFSVGFWPISTLPANELFEVVSLKPSRPSSDTSAELPVMLRKSIIVVKVLNPDRFTSEGLSVNVSLRKLVTPFKPDKLTRPLIFAKLRLRPAVVGNEAINPRLVSLIVGVFRIFRLPKLDALFNVVKSATGVLSIVSVTRAGAMGTAVTLGRASSCRTPVFAAR